MEGQDNAPAVTIESLQAQLETEQAAHLATKEALESEQANLLALAGEHQLAQASLVEATGIIAGQKETIAQQEEKIIALQVAPAAHPSFTVDRVTYEVEVKNFKYKGADYTVEQLLKDKKLQKELVGKNVGFLVKKEV